MLWKRSSAWLCWMYSKRASPTQPCVITFELSSRTEFVEGNNQSPRRSRRGHGLPDSRRKYCPTLVRSLHQLRQQFARCYEFPIKYATIAQLHSLNNSHLIEPSRLHAIASASMWNLSCDVHQYHAFQILKMEAVTPPCTTYVF